MTFVSPLGKALYVLSMVAAAAVPVVIRSIELPASTIALSRAALAAVAMLVLALLTMQSVFRLHWRDLLPLLIAGAALGGGWYCHVNAVKITGVLAAQAALATSAMWSVLIGPFFRTGYQSHFSYFVLAFLTLVGLVLTMPNFDIPHRENLGTVYGAAAGLLLAVGGQTIMRVLQLYPMERMGNAVMLLQYLAATAVLAVSLIWVPIPPETWTPETGGKLILLGLVLLVLSRVLAGSGGRAMTPGVLYLVQATEPFVAAALAALFLREIPLLRVACGAVLIAGAGLLAMYIQFVGPRSIFKPLRWN